MVNTNRSLWCIEQKAYDAQKEDFYESLFSLGNGYMGTRGFQEESYKREPHERCQFIAGVFDYIKKGITDMVNTPNYFCSVVTVNGEKMDFDQGKILEYQSILDMKKGILIRDLLWENSKGQITRIKKERFVSLDQIHLAVARYTLIPMNYSGVIALETGIDAGVKNNPISDDQLKENVETVCLLDVKEHKGIKNGGYIKVATKQSGYEIFESYRLKCDVLDEKIISKGIIESDFYIGSRVECKVHEGEAVTFEKVISVYTSRDGMLCAENETIELSQQANESGYERLAKSHSKAWEEKWQIADIQIEGDNKLQQAIRYNIFQLIQTNAERDEKVSIGARGIMHGRYKGCYFWDTEIFMLPFFLYTNPVAAKSLLMYRYHSLEGARANAKDLNLEGVKFPWMSATEGREQCESWDTGSCEVHINADIPYAIEHYYKATGDNEFLLRYGAQIYIETARYWKSRFTYDAVADVYNMIFVKGPNEYGGATVNNTYTTYMALHNFKLAMNTILWMKKLGQWEPLKEKLQFEDIELEKWQKIIDKAVIHYDQEKNLYIEDSLFYQLEPIELDRYKESAVPLYKKVCFDRLQRYRVLKQADVILLMTLLPAEFNQQEKLAAWQTYEPITLHDSTLSFGTHAIMASMLGLDEKAYEYLEKSVYLDLDNLMENTDVEGIHSAALGISWQAIVFGIAGLAIEEDGLVLKPRLPKKWQGISFKFVYLYNVLQFTINHSELTVQLSQDSVLDVLEIKVFEKAIFAQKNEKMYMLL